jgi:isoleucyl-tRNA synthetase
MSITKEFMNGEWQFLKAMHERGLLYEGERTVRRASSAVLASLLFV